MERGVGGQSHKTRTLIPDTGTHAPRMTLPRAWVRFNHLRTSVRHFRSCLNKWAEVGSSELLK